MAETDGTDVVYSGENTATGTQDTTVTPIGTNPSGSEYTVEDHVRG